MYKKCMQLLRVKYVFQVSVSPEIKFPGLNNDQVLTLSVYTLNTIADTQVSAAPSVTNH